MTKLKLTNVRLSFPSLFQTEFYSGTDTGKYTATFLMDKESKQAKAIHKAVKATIKEKFGPDASKKLPTCVKDGDDVEYDGYAGMLAIKANTKRRPVLYEPG